MYLFPLFLPYMFRALISLSSGVSQAVFYIQPFDSCVGQEINLIAIRTEDARYEQPKIQ